MSNFSHTPVLLTEVLTNLHVNADRTYVDCTFGRGGHTGEMLKLGAKVIAFDVDQEAIDYGSQHFDGPLKTGQLTLVRANFDRLAEQLQKIHAPEISGVFADFGVSSPQIDNPARGFSLQTDGELDMRMDQRLGVKAKDLLAILPENQLAQLFAENGEESAKAIARAIAKKRQTQPLQTTAELVDLIHRHKPFHGGHLHPSTKVFQALRIAVNMELESIHNFLPQALDVVASQGTIVTISFHEGEDRIVKTTFKDWESHGFGQHLTKNIITASEQELALNPRARSAKLRVFQKK